MSTVTRGPTDCAYNVIYIIYYKSTDYNIIYICVCVLHMSTCDDNNTLEVRLDVKKIIIK